MNSEVIEKINNYLNEINITNDYKNNLVYLIKICNKFRDFFEKTIDDIDDLMTLIKENEKLNHILKIVVNENIDNIKKNKIEKIIDDEIVISLVSTYCMINNININFEIDEKIIDSNDPVKIYLNEIGQFPLLSPEEEMKLAANVARGDQEARKKFINSNLKLVVSIAKRYIGKGLEFLDLISEGNLGLMKAVDRFDLKKGYKFSTYATWWIRHFMIKALQDKVRTIRIPVGVSEKYNKVKNIHEELTKELKREPTTKEIADKMHMTEKELVKLISNFNQEPVSLENPVGDGDTTLKELIEDSDNPKVDEYVYYTIEKENIKEELSKILSSQEVIVILMRFGLKDNICYTLEKVGEKLCVTRERARQIEKKALKKIHNHYNINEENYNLKDTWEEKYALAKMYYEEHGDLLVPQRYKINEVKIGRWINVQRQKYREGTLIKEQIKKLEDIAMVWNIKKYNLEISINENLKNNNRANLFILINKLITNYGDFIISSFILSNYDVDKAYVFEIILNIKKNLAKEELDIFILYLNNYSDAVIAQFYNVKETEIKRNRLLIIKSLMVIFQKEKQNVKVKQ